MQSFGEYAFLSSSPWRSAKRLVLALPSSPIETCLLWLVAEWTGHFAPRQQALLTRAFAQA